MHHLGFGNCYDVQNKRGEDHHQVEQRPAARSTVLYNTDYFNSSPTTSQGAAASGNRSKSDTVQTPGTLVNGAPMEPNDESSNAEPFKIYCNMEDPARSSIVVKLRNKNMNLLFDGNDQRLKRIHIHGQALLKLRIGINMLRTNKLYDLYHAFAGTSTGYLCSEKQAYVIPVPGGTLLCSLSLESFNEIKSSNVQPSENRHASTELPLDRIIFSLETDDPLIVTDIILSYDSGTSPSIVYSNNCNWKRGLLSESVEQSIATAALRLRMYTSDGIPSKQSQPTSSRIEDMIAPSRSDVIVTGIIVNGSDFKHNFSPNIAWMEYECLLPIGCSKQELLSVLGPCDWIRHDCSNKAESEARIGEWHVYTRLGAECLLEADSPHISEVWLSQSLPGHPTFGKTSKCRTLVRLVRILDETSVAGEDQTHPETIIDLSLPWETIREQLCEHGMAEEEEPLCMPKKTQEKYACSVHNMSSSLLFEVTTDGYIASIGVCAPS